MDMIPKESAAMDMETRGSLLLTRVNSVNRRKRMEATSMARGGGEVRRVHIIYFLCRMGRVEQPHLIRVHHLHRNGVHLHDVKRWLADLRGKEMPEAYAWSYKRTYKNGYVWQDLLDDDLITPISDNEYVLKGSEICVPTIDFEKDTSPFEPRKEDANAYEEEKEAFMPEKMQVDEEDQRHQEQPSPRETDLRTEYTAMKHSSEISEESVAFSSEMSSTLTEDSTKPEDQLQEPEVDDYKVENLPPLFRSNLLCTKDKKKRCDNDSDSDSNNSNNSNNSNQSYDKKKMGTPTSLPSSSQYISQSPFPKTKSYSASSGTSRMLRNLITCGAVETNDAAVVAVKKQSPEQPNKSTEISRAESTRAFGSCWNQQQHSARKSFDGSKGTKKGNHQQHQKGFGSKKVVSSAYMPVGAPTCSQCGKPFRPEKLHSHMKSCKGRKSFARTRSTASPSEKKSWTTTTAGTVTEESTGGYFLTR